jgi:hypothetical protein
MLLASRPRRSSPALDSCIPLNLENFTSFPSLEFILGTGLFLGPQLVEVAPHDGLVRHLTSGRIFIDTGSSRK